MKRFLPVLLIIILIISSFTACTNDEEVLDPEELINQEVLDEYNSFISAVKDAAGISEIKSYLMDWAKQNNIKASSDKYDNVIMTIKATENDKRDPATILQCRISTEQIEEDGKSIATALYVLKASKEQNEHDLIRVLFIDNTNGQMSSAEKIDKKYLDADYLINLNGEKQNAIFNASAGSASFTLSRPIDWHSPAYPNAYEISIQGLAVVDTSILDVTRPNPIKAIGDLLAGAKSAGILFELSGINGGLSGDTYATATTAVIIINDNDVKKFEKRFSSAQNDFLDKYTGANPHLTYTLTPVPMPDKVVSAEDCSSMISLLYTMVHGVYLRSDTGETIAASNLGSISTYTGRFLADVFARSTSQETLDEISTTLETICGLCNVEYAITDTFPIWVADENSELQLKMEALMEEKTGKSVKKYAAHTYTIPSVFKERNPGLDIISINPGDINKSYHTAEILLEFLASFHDVPPPVK